MVDQVEVLRANLRSDNLQTVEDAAVKLSEIAWKEPERIEPAVDALQEVVRNGSGNAPGKAVSALARYGSKVDKNALEPVKKEILELLKDGNFNQQNALLGVTVLRSSEFKDSVHALTESGGTSLTAASALTFVRVTDSDFEWLPVRQRHVRQIVSDGIRRVRKENPELLLYILDDRCGASGQEVSARDQLLQLNNYSPEFAETVTRFVNEYPEEGISSLHVGILSQVASSHPNTVIESLEQPVAKFREASGQTRIQFLWTFANVAEEAPEAVGEDIISLSRDIVASGSHKEAVQGIRLLGAVNDVESIGLIQDRMEGGHHKVRSVGEDALESLTEAGSDSDDTEDDDNSFQVEQAADTEYSEDLMELRRKAEEAAQENPIREQVSPSSQYHRSTDIKDYAKARADGVCECCGEPAPFHDEAGEPYLEVHHVDELGEGGADSPERVVAVCPTCHMRIHYGADGEEINSELKNKLYSGLADAGTS